MLALALRLGAALLVSTLYASVKLAGRMGVALPEIMFWRQVVSLPMLGLWLAANGRLGDLRTSRLRAHIGRGAAGTLGMAANFGASMLLPLAVATVLGFAAPLFAVVLAALVLREHVGPWRWIAVALGFAGVVLIARPGALHVAPLGIALGVFAGLMVAVVALQLRDLAQTEPSLTIVFYFAVVGTALMLPFQPFVMHWHTPAQWAVLLGLGVVGTLGQLLLTSALRYGRVASVVVMDYTSLIWMTLFGWAWFDQLPPPTIWLGAPLVIAAGMVIAWREALRTRPAPIQV